MVKRIIWTFTTLLAISGAIFGLIHHDRTVRLRAIFETGTTFNSGMMPRVSVHYYSDTETKLKVALELRDPNSAKQILEENLRLNILAWSGDSANLGDEIRTLEITNPHSPRIPQLRALQAGDDLLIQGLRGNLATLKNL